MATKTQYDSDMLYHLIDAWTMLNSTLPNQPSPLDKIRTWAKMEEIRLRLQQDFNIVRWIGEQFPDGDWYREER